MAIRQDDIKGAWEGQTLAYFLAYSAGVGPTYRFLERRERPDRVIKADGSSQLIGVEVTRIVQGEDAMLRRAVARLHAEMEDELAPYADGGRVDLYRGRFPDLSKEGREKLCAALRQGIETEGSLTAFVESLPRGKWHYGESIFDFRQIGKLDGWRFTNNTTSAPQARSLSEEEIGGRLLERVQDKARKSGGYNWAGPLLLLVRNTYQAFQPSQAVLNECRSQLASSRFQQAWLVNHTEGILDAEPPEPRLVHLGP